MGESLPLRALPSKLSSAGGWGLGSGGAKKKKDSWTWTTNSVVIAEGRDVGGGGTGV